ncbi:hypothetical protein LINPERHAP1_LOCUS5347 [Linum perenne]
MPPLTPPPSFYSAASMNSNSSAARNLLGTLFSGGGNFWSSSSSSSTSSSGRDSADVYMSRRKKKKPRLMSRWFFCSGRRLAVADGDHRWLYHSARRDLFAFDLVDQPLPICGMWLYLAQLRDCAILLRISHLCTFVSYLICPFAGHGYTLPITGKCYPVKDQPIYARLCHI